MKINGIHHVALTVSNLEQSVSFYQQFGFVEQKRFERKDLKGKAVFLSLGNTKLEIWKFDGAVESKDNLSSIEVKGLRHIALSVDNLDEVYAELNARMKISEPKLGASGGRYSFIIDPDGILVELYED